MQPLSQAQGKLLPGGGLARAPLAGRPSPARPFQGAQKAPRAASTETAEAASNNGASGNSTNPLDFDELTDIIRMVHDTDIVELELKSKKFSLAVRKKEALEKAEPVYVQAAAPVVAAPAPAPAPAAAPAPAPAPAPAAPAAPSSSGGGGASTAGTVEVASPMSGTFYMAPAPGEPPFVKVGDKVTKGQPIGIIEAMKLMNEIEADASGTIVEFMVENASSVAPGQGLIRIKP